MSKYRIKFNRKVKASGIDDSQAGLGDRTATVTEKRYVISMVEE